MEGKYCGSPTEGVAWLESERLNGQILSRDEIYAF